MDEIKKNVFRNRINFFVDVAGIPDSIVDHLPEIPVHTVPNLKKVKTPSKRSQSGMSGSFDLECLVYVCMYDARDQHQIVAYISNYYLGHNLDRSLYFSHYLDHILDSDPDHNLRRYLEGIV